MGKKKNKRREWANKNGADDAATELLDLTEAVTGEFRILEVEESAAESEKQDGKPRAAADAAPASGDPTPGDSAPADPAPAGPTPAEESHLNGSAVEPPQPAELAEGRTAALVLSRLEAEIARVQQKWVTIDAEFKAREARVVELRELVASRDAAIEQLKAELQRDRDALRAGEQRFAEKETEVAALAAERQARDDRIEALLAEAAAQAGRQQELQQRLDAEQAEVTRIGDELRHVQATAEGLAKHNEDLAADKRALQIKLQDLEGYIDGRRRSWSDLQARLDDYQSTIVAMEKTIDERDAAIARHDDEKQHLATQILELERRSAELAGRRKEREAAYDELQRKLQQHFETTEQLKAQHAKKTQDTEQALAKAVTNQKLVESLERGITRRDENLAAITAELEEKKAAVTTLLAGEERLNRRIDEMERGLQERSAQSQSLREEAREAHEELRRARQQLAERDTHLAASQSMAEEKARAADRSAERLQAAEADLAAARASISQLEDQAGQLARAQTQAEQDAERSKAELAAQQELVASLETELRSKQATVDLLERNIGRISNLGASLAELDRRMDMPDRLPPAPAADFGATVAGNSPVDAEASADMLPIEIFMGSAAQPDADIGVPLDVGGRKFIMLTGGAGDDVDYPLVKTEMTIGRGHDSDIRIASHFISRLHATISTLDGRTVIEDAGSKNGILVNSKRVKRRVLHDGDIVSLGGELSLRFVEHRP